LIRVDDEAATSETRNKDQGAAPRKVRGDEEIEGNRESASFATQSQTYSVPGSSSVEEHYEKEEKESVDSIELNFYSTASCEKRLSEWFQTNKIQLGGKFELIKKAHPVAGNSLLLTTVKNGEEKTYYPDSQLALELLDKKYGNDFRVSIAFYTETKDLLFR
jgi:hypothetical protein